MTPVEQIRSEIESLRASLLSNNPGMPTMLRTIHTNLSKDSELVTLLSEDEIGVVVRGLMKQTNTVIAAGVSKAAKSTKKLKGITLDML